MLTRVSLAFVAVAALALSACGDKAPPASTETPAPQAQAATAGPDAFVGADGANTVSYANAPAAVYVMFGDMGHATGWAQGDTFTGILNITGSPFDDVIGMGDGANTIEGGNGGDQIWGRGGDDRLVGGPGADRYVYDGAGFGHDTIVGYEDHSDMIDMVRYPGLRFSQLVIAPANGGTMVTIGADSIFLEGVDPANITADDFFLPH